MRGLSTTARARRFPGRPVALGRGNLGRGNRGGLVRRASIRHRGQHDDLRGGRRHPHGDEGEEREQDERGAEQRSSPEPAPPRPARLRAHPTGPDPGGAPSRSAGRLVGAGTRNPCLGLVTGSVPARDALRRKVGGMRQPVQTCLLSALTRRHAGTVDGRCAPPRGTCALPAAPAVPPVCGHLMVPESSRRAAPLTRTRSTHGPAPMHPIRLVPGKQGRVPRYADWSQR